jgi:glycerol-1-phosphate dehydrogenase [NAD(P)+]
VKKIWPISKIELISFDEIEETRPVALVYSLPAWQAVEQKLHLPIAWKIEVLEATIENWNNLIEGFQGEVVYSVGGGLPADAAKYISAKKNVPMVCLPTALSVDAYLTWASGIREKGCVRYIETKTPETLIIDLDVIAAGPASIRAAGICDVLSIATGKWDWKFASEQGKNPPGMEFIPYIEKAASAILQGALDCAEAAGKGDQEGLKQLLDCLALEVQLTNQIGHARPEEGSEHYFAYAVENEVGHGKPHADLLGPGILLMAEAQGQDIFPLKKAMEATHIPLKGIPREVVLRTLHGLPEYCFRQNLPYGIAHVLTKEAIQKIDLGFIA